MQYSTSEVFEKRGYAMKKKRIGGAVAAIVLALGLGLGLALLPALGGEAFAATGSSMKSLKVKWDLKKGKKVTVTTAWAGVGKQKVSARVTALKVGASSRRGYRKASFTVEFTQLFKPTKKQVHALARVNDAGQAAGFASFALVDYQTGRELGAYRKRKVTIKTSGWKCSKTKKYKDNDGCWVQYPMKYSMKVTVTFPQKYKRLCLGIIANAKRSETKADGAFWKGQGSFAKTTYYKSGKSNSHWMRIA